MICRILIRPNGHPDGEGLTIIHPAPQARLEGEDDATFYTRVFLQTVEKNPSMQGLTGINLERSKLPNRRFRNAWRVVGNEVKVDLDIAREIRLQEIRCQRNEKFVPLDREWMKYTGQGNVVAAVEIEMKRQSLRDVPQTMESKLKDCKTPEEIDAICPEWP